MDTGAYFEQQKLDMHVDLAESETEQAEEFYGQFTDVFSQTSENEVPQLRL